jgi:hypothetical protein
MALMMMMMMTVSMGSDYVSELRPPTDLLSIAHVIYEHREPWWNDIDRVKLLIRPPELSGNPTSNHLVANQEERAKETFGLTKHLYSYFKGICNMPENLTTWTLRLNFPCKERRPLCKGFPAFKLCPFRSIFIHISKGFVTCRKILRHGLSGLTSLPKKGVKLVLPGVLCVRDSPHSNCVPFKRDTGRQKSRSRVVVYI